MCGVLQRFWSSLSGKYGNKFYWQDNGQEAAIVNAVSFAGWCRPCGVLCPAAPLPSAMTPLKGYIACHALSSGQRHRLLHQGAAGQGQVRQGAPTAAAA